MRDNQATVTLGGRDIVAEASLAACVEYSNEFRGKLADPYSGALMDDMLALYRAADGGDGEGGGVEAVIGDGGEPLLRIVWAMGRASGSVKEGYKAFVKSMAHSPLNLYEFVEAYHAVVGDLGGRVFFRLPEGRGDAGEPDEAEVEEG